MECLNDEGGNLVGERRDDEACGNQLWDVIMETLGSRCVRWVIKCKQVILAPDASRKTEQVRHNVFVPFDVLAGEAMGAVEQ